MPRIGEFAPIPIPLAANNVYTLRLAEGGALLVDAGPDLAGTWEQAVAQVATHGIAPGDVRVVIVTHAHADHAGLAARWAEHGARVLAGAMDVPALLAGRAWSDARVQHRIETLQQHGAPHEVLEAQAAQATRSGYGWQPCPPGSVEPVADGAQFALDGGGALRVLYAPGHTPGNLVAYVPDRSELYSGDTVLPGTIPAAGLHFPEASDGSIGPRWPSLPPYLASMRRLRALRARRVLPGHGAPVDDATRLLDRFDVHHARRAARVRALLVEQPDSAYGLARRLFPRLSPRRMAQATVEVIGHIDVLQEVGEVLCEARAGVVLYTLVASEPPRPARRGEGARG